MSSLQFVVAILGALAWPTAVVIAVVLVRPHLTGVFQRVQSLEFPGGRVTFAALVDVQKAVSVVAEEAASRGEGGVVRYEGTEFSVVAALTSAAPGQAVIGAWGLLEYQLNVASDSLAPDQPHGWPQVVRNLQMWDKWPVLLPAVQELRRLRDYTAMSRRQPSSEDAARYVSVAQELTATIRASFISHPSQPGQSPGGGQ